MVFNGTLTASGGYSSAVNLRCAGAVPLTCTPTPSTLTPTAAGAPFTVTADGTTLNTPGNLQVADLVGPLKKIGQIGAAGYYYDPAAWAQPDGVRFGTSRVNQFRGPGGANLDMSLFRSFPLGGTLHITVLP